MGDFVVVTNAEKVRLTGTKLDAKVYRRHTGYPGGLRRRRPATAGEYPER
jgi:large subunit ribosomal protein L13